MQSEPTGLRVHPLAALLGVAPSGEARSGTALAARWLLLLDHALRASAQVAGRSRTISGREAQGLRCLPAADSTAPDF